MDLNNILGVVLAGGKSQRFGQDKSQVKLQNKLLIDYILKEIIDEFEETLIIANEPIKFMQSENISVTKDFKNAIESKDVEAQIAAQEQLANLTVESARVNALKAREVSTPKEKEFLII